MPDEPRDSEENQAQKSQQDAAAETPSEAPKEPLEGTLEDAVDASTEQAEVAADSTPADDAATGEEAPQDVALEQEVEEAVAAVDPIEELKLALDAERARADENYDLVLRTKAEMDNLRKRSANEVDKARKFALEKFASEIVAVRDSLEMGLDAASQADADVNSIREGTDLTLKMLITVMDKFAVEQVDPAGQPFDPELHQAMGMQESSEHAPNTVMVVMQKGYTLNGRLLRPAMVMVSKAASS